jgi:hypothetical protein
MASYVKFQSFVEAAMEGKHDFVNDVFKVALCNAENAPSASDDAVLADLTTVSVVNLDGVTVTISSSGQVAGTYKAVATDLKVTASGAVGPFRYAVIYNDSAPNDELVCYFDYGSEVTMQSPDTFTFDFGTELFSLA